jgi:hypothetical protein
MTEMAKKEMGEMAKTEMVIIRKRSSLGIL